MVINIFEFQNYRPLMLAHLKSMPDEGYGKLSQAAKSMGIAPSLLTSVMKDEKHFTPEQALSWATWAEWTELESEYFLNLVQYERAGTIELRNHFGKKMKEPQAKSSLLKSRLPPQAELPEEAKAIFYSDWSYSAIRLCTSLSKVTDANGIANELKIPRNQVMRILDFLLRNNLVLEDKTGLHMGTQSTHVGAQEPLVARHHTNWRLKAIEKFSKDPSAGLFFTSPVSISFEDFETIKKIIMTSLDKVFDVVDPSPAEKIACLNIDWFFLNED